MIILKFWPDLSCSGLGLAFKSEALDGQALALAWPWMVRPWPWPGLGK